MKLRFVDGDEKGPQGTELAVPPCTVQGEPGKKFGIYSLPVSENKEYFRRLGNKKLISIDLDDFGLSKYPEKTICV